jgi:hypothetical protein
MLELIRFAFFQNDLLNHVWVGATEVLVPVNHRSILTPILDSLEVIVVELSLKRCELALGAKINWHYIGEKGL